MKYVIREVKDSITQEEAIANAKKLFRSMKEEVEKQLPVAMIYGLNNKKGNVYFQEPVVCNSDKELVYERDRLLKLYPESTILTLFKGSLMHDSKKRINDVELEYTDLTITIWILTSRAVLYPVDNAHPDEYDDEEIQIDWTYDADEDEVADYFNENAEKYDELKDLSEEEIDKYIDEHFGELVDKYYDDLLIEFEDKAREDAEENYEAEEPDPEDYEPDYDDEW